MARGPFPRLDLNEQISPDVAGSMSDGGGSARALGAISAASEAFGQKLQGLAERAAQREGEEAAAADALSGGLSPKDAGTVFGRAYNQVAQDAMASQRDAAMIDAVDQALQANPDNPGELAKALDAAKAGFGKTGYPALDARLDGVFATRRVAAIGKARDGQRLRLIDQAKANFLTDAQTAETSLVQTASQARLDGDGDQAVGGALASYVLSLARHGPKEAFTVAGVQVAADPSRDGLLSVEAITAQALQGVSGAKRARILGTMDRLPDAAGKARMATDLRQRWNAGDPLFEGMDGPSAERLFGAIDGQVRTAETAERSAAMEAGQRARDMLEAGRYGADVDFDDMRALAARSGDVGLQAQAEYAAQVGFAEPGAAQGLAYDGDPTAAPGFAAAADFVIDAIEGGEALVENDNGKGATRWGINQTANPDLEVRTLSRGGAVKRYRRYWNSVGGDALPPALALVAFDAAVNQGEERAARWVAQSGGDVGRYLALRRQAYQDLAKQPGQARNLAGWMARLDKIGGRAARIQAFANVQEGFGSDPMRYALGTRSRPALANVPALNALDALSEDPGAVAAWGRTIGQRRALGATLAQTYRVPARMLTDAERDQLADQLADDPAKGVALAAAAEGAIGAAGARELLREVGVKNDQAGLAVHVAELRAGGQRAFAGGVLEGLRLRAEGAKAPPIEKGEPTWDEVQSKYAPALAATPGLMPAAREAAELARLADLQKGRAADVEFYLRSALGGTPVGKTWFGGPGQVNGRSTVLPGWLAVDQADDALREIGGKWVAGGYAPVYANGQPMDAKAIGGLQLELAPSGRYRLISRRTQAPVRGRDGRLFEVDLDGERAFVASRLRSAVMGGR